MMMAEEAVFHVVGGIESNGLSRHKKTACYWATTHRPFKRGAMR